ncbi:MAG: phosphatidate cytidylyltransferase [Spirochaetales bacterium]|nr:phosphatidate cytidylyltransferase [Spirochaetales bacterium]
MNNLTQRFLLAAIALPLLVILVLFLPYFHHVALALAAAVFSGLGTLEMARMFSRRGVSFHPLPTFLMGISLPLAAWVDTAGFLQTDIFLPLFTGLVLVILSRQALILRQEYLAQAAERLSFTGFLLIYPGLLMSFLPRMTGLSEPQWLILLFLSLIFANDSAAYGFGMLLGKGNRNIFAASPNKSLAGLIGGVAGSLGAAYLFYAFLPGLFRQQAFLPLLPAISCSLAANLGDLAESAVKRSTAVKDSGKILKGRGGVMDSIDSIIFAAPVFYFVAEHLLSPGGPK